MLSYFSSLSIHGALNFLHIYRPALLSLRYKTPPCPKSLVLGYHVRCKHNYKSFGSVGHSREPAIRRVPFTINTTDPLESLPSLDERIFRYVQQYQKQLMPKSPNQVLIQALKVVGYDHALPPDYTEKEDLSFLRPKDLHSKSLSASSTAHAKNKLEYPSSPEKFSLQSVLAKYILLFHSAEAKRAMAQNPEWAYSALDKIFDERSIDGLASRGFEVEDVVSWAWIITVTSSEQAAIRLLRVCNTICEVGKRKVPDFVLLFLLRRGHISKSGLRLLIIHVKDRLGNRHNASWETHTRSKLPARLAPENEVERSEKQNGSTPVLPYYPKMMESSTILMIVRLVRHARKILPEALPTLASLFAEYVNGTITSENGIQPVVAADLSFAYNNFLSLLALPSSRTPFKSILHHQRAQFTVLRKMAQFQPALLVNREGYRGVVQVQLAHRKTPIERDWATMKANTWPPWKRDRLGIDADKDLQHGISRAKEALTKLSASGYGSYSWEDSASILSGWDTDHSPTIQTRSVLNAPRLRKHKGLSDEGRSSEGLVWAARIRATRTVDEAWVCFLAYKGEQLPPSLEAYHAMFEKLIYEEKRRSSNWEKPLRKELRESHALQVLPGGGLEVSDPPTDPRERVYVPTPPPDVEAFFNTAIDDGVVPKGRLLGLLLLHAKSYSIFVRYLEHSDWPLQIVRMISGRVTPSPILVKTVPQNEFAAIVQQLSRWGLSLPSNISRMSENCSAQTTRREAPVNLLLHAFRLVLNSSTTKLKPWNILFAAIYRRNTIIDDPHIRKDSFSQYLGKWNLAAELLKWMYGTGIEPDFNTFYFLCRQYSAAALASYKAPASDTQPVDRLAMDWPNSNQCDCDFAQGQSDVRQSEQGRDHQILRLGVFELKTLFLSLTTSRLDSQQPWNGLSSHRSHIDPTEMLNSVVDAPNPVYLHAFIVALGMAQDHKGIRDIVAWMAHSAPELSAVVAEQENGMKQLRRCLVSVRAFLDGRWDGGESRLCLRPASDDILQEVQQISKGVGDWGSWPSDDEVQSYCNIYLAEHSQ